MPRSLLFWLLLLCPVAATGCDWGNGPGLSERPIIFSGTNNASGSDLWSVTLEDTVPVNLTSGDGTDVTPAVSRDGNTIAFTTDGPPLGLFRMAIDGSGKIPLETADQFDWYPSWSPSGKQIAFERVTPDGEHEIWIMDADGTDAHLVIAPGMQPSWSPKGLQLAYEGADCQIWLVNIDGTDPRPLRQGSCTSDTTYSQAAWSPDGQQLAAVANATGSFAGVVILAPDGSSARLLTVNPTDRFPTWSADGSLLLFVRLDLLTGRQALMMVLSTGAGQPQTISSGWGVLSRPSW
jgi:Tol biopolymer transport system component